MSDGFDEVMMGDFAVRMSEAVDHLVMLRGAVNAAVDSDDGEAVEAAGMALASFITSVSLGVIPTVLVSLAQRVIDERLKVLNLLDVIHDQVDPIRQAVSDLTTKRDNAALMSLLDVANDLVTAAEESGYERVQADE
jgi:hypothetical protein